MSPLRIAQTFARGLDTESYDAVARCLHRDCEYSIAGQTHRGPEAIIASYRGNADWASSTLEEIKYESSVRQTGERSAIVEFVDHLRHAGRTHTHRCEQHLEFDEAGLIGRIHHVDLPGEQEALRAFFAAVGLDRDQKDRGLPAITCSTSKAITPEQFIDVLRRSSLAARRPVDDRQCIQSMLANADLTVTAWEGEMLVGVARSVTDFSYCCYLSDLAVDVARQRSGIGRELLRRTKAALGPRCKLILLSAPAASGYYPKVGFEQHRSAWVIEGDRPIA